MEDLSSRAEIRGQIQEAFTLTSLGLEYGCEGTLDKSVRLLNSNRLIKFFQIGNTLVDKLVERSQNTLEKAVLISPAMQNVEQEKIPAYNEWESDFLESVIERKLAIDAAQISLNQLSANPRSLMGLADINVAKSTARLYQPPMSATSKHYHKRKFSPLTIRRTTITTSPAKSQLH